MDCSPPDSSVHGILQARILEWVTMPSSRGFSWPSDWTCVSYLSYIAGRVFTTEPPGKALINRGKKINEKKKHFFKMLKFPFGGGMCGVYMRVHVCMYRGRDEIRHGWYLQDTLIFTRGEQMRIKAFLVVTPNTWIKLRGFTKGTFII